MSKEGGGKEYDVAVRSGDAPRSRSSLADGLEFQLGDDELPGVWTLHAQDVRTIIAALRSETERTPAAFIEHHKGGDNLIWERSNLRCTPLYTKAAPQVAEGVSQGDANAGVTPSPAGAAPCVERQILDPSVYDETDQHR